MNGVGKAEKEETMKNRCNYAMTPNKKQYLRK